MSKEEIEQSVETVAFAAYTHGKYGVAFTQWYTDSLHKDAIAKSLSDFAAQSVREDRESRWISVKDKLPEEGDEVIVWSDRYGRTIATLRGTNKYGSFWLYSGDHIVTYNAPLFWQPLPSPPTNKG